MTKNTRYELESEQSHIASTADQCHLIYFLGTSHLFAIIPIELPDKISPFPRTLQIYLAFS